MKQRFAYCVFCDDIRFELGNKNSYMGIYESTLLVEDVPCILPKICVALNFHCPVDTPVSSFGFYIKLDETVVSEQFIPEDQVTLSNQVLLLNKKSKSLNYKINAIISPFPIESVGMLTATVIVDGKDYLAGTLDIQRTQLI